MIPKSGNRFFPRDKREAFARRSCSNKKIERDDDSKKSHPALGSPAGVRNWQHFSGWRGRTMSVHRGRPEVVAPCTMERNTRFVCWASTLSRRRSTSSAFYLACNMSGSGLAYRSCGRANGSNNGKYTQFPDRQDAARSQRPIAAAGLDRPDRHFLRRSARGESSGTKPARHAGGSAGIVQNGGEA